MGPYPQSLGISNGHSFSQTYVTNRKSTDSIVTSDNGAINKKALPSLLVFVVGLAKNDKFINKMCRWLLRALFRFRLPILNGRLFSCLCLRRHLHSKNKKLIAPANTIIVPDNVIERPWKMIHGVFAWYWSSLAGFATVAPRTVTPNRIHAITDPNQTCLITMLRNR